MQADGIPAFGAYALPVWLEMPRRFAASLGSGTLARRTGSMVRRAIYALRRDPFDVEPFPGQRARLYPRENLSEKRVFTAPQLWDAAEREAIGAEIARREAPFRFVDAGANVGLYTLAVRSMARVEGRSVKALAIEPDPANLARLRFNLCASGALDEVEVASVALAAEPGEAVLESAGANRGEVALAASGDGVRVATVPLAELVQGSGFDRIDALKIDIEGMEAPVLEAFFASAPQALHPGLVLVEARRGEETPALALLRSKGYVEAQRTRLNVILRAPESGAAPTTN